jgi:hypothetical protein
MGGPTARGGVSPRGRRARPGLAGKRGAKPRGAPRCPPAPTPSRPRALPLQKLLIPRGARPAGPRARVRGSTRADLPRAAPPRPQRLRARSPLCHGPGLPRPQGPGGGEAPGAPAGSARDHGGKAAPLAGSPPARRPHGAPPPPPPPAWPGGGWCRGKGAALPRAAPAPCIPTFPLHPPSPHSSLRQGWGILSGSSARTRRDSKPARHGGVQRRGAARAGWGPPARRAHPSNQCGGHGQQPAAGMGCGAARARAGARAGAAEWGDGHSAWPTVFKTVRCFSDEGRQRRQPTSS